VGVFDENGAQFFPTSIWQWIEADSRVNFKYDSLCVHDAIVHFRRRAAISGDAKERRAISRTDDFRRAGRAKKTLQIRSQAKLIRFRFATAASSKSIFALSESPMNSARNPEFKD